MSPGGGVWRAPDAACPRQAPRLGSVIHVGEADLLSVRGACLPPANPPPMTAVFRRALLPSIRAKSTLRPLPIHRLVSARLVVNRLSPVIAMQAVLLFAAIPYHLFQGGLDRLLIIVLVAFITAATLVRSAIRWYRCKLKRSQYWSLAASQICLPLSLNFPRKLALLAGSAVDADQLMARVPATAKWPMRPDIVILDYADWPSRKLSGPASSWTVCDRSCPVSELVAGLDLGNHQDHGALPGHRLRRCGRFFHVIWGMIGGEETRRRSVRA